MPELPEVETIRLQLNQAIKNKTIKAIQVYRQKSFQADTQTIIGLKVTQVARQAKMLEIHFEQKFPVLLIHLKMTGQLIYLDKSKNKKITGGHPTLDWINKLPSKHTRVSITFDDNSKLFFNDIRVFGWLKPVSSQKELDHEQRNFKGLEPGKPEFTLTNLRGALSRTKRPVKTAIMDQALIAGVGNIYANDALWDAKVSPAKPANTLTQGELKRLRTSLVKVIKLGIKHGGATDSDYRQLNGMGGSYQKYFLTYRQTGKPCKRCQTPIKKLHLGGRGTFLCPVCQA